MGKKSDFFKLPELNKNMIILFGCGGYLYSMMGSFPELTVAGMAGDGVLALRELRQNVVLCFEHSMFEVGVWCRRLLQLTVLSQTFGTRVSSTGPWGAEGFLLLLSPQSERNNSWCQEVQEHHP